MAVEVIVYHQPEAARKLVRKFQEMMHDAREGRGDRPAQWRRNEELYNGDFLAPFNLPKYKSKIIPNTVHSTIETAYSILTDRRPMVDFMPTTKEQILPAKEAQDAVVSEMRRRKAWRSVNLAKRDLLMYGNGYIKPMYSKRLGHIIYPVLDPYTVFPDPLATSIENLSYIVLATPTYVADIHKLYPSEAGRAIRDEGKLDAYRSFVHKTAQKGNPQIVGNIPTAAGDYLDTGDAAYNPQQYSLEGRAGALDIAAAGQALLHEIYYLDDDGKMRLGTWAGDILLQDTAWNGDTVPLVLMTNYRAAHSWWGKSEPEVIESLAVGTAVLLSQGIDDIILNGNPAWDISATVLQNPRNTPTNKPGQVFHRNNPGEIIRRIPPGNISPSTLPMVATLMQITDQTSQIHDVTQGRNPTGVTASRAIQQLQEASQQVIRAKERETGEDGVVELYKQTLQIMAKRYTEKIKVSVWRDGTWDFKELMPSALDDKLEFDYIPGSSLPESREGRLDRALTLWASGVFEGDVSKFWRATQQDISKDMMAEVAAQELSRQDAIKELVAVIQSSDNEDEVQQALYQLRSLYGFDQTAQAGGPAGGPGGPQARGANPAAMVPR